MHLQHRAYTPAATERILEPLRLRRRVLEVSLRIADGRNASAQELARSKEQLVLSTQTHFSCRALLADKNSCVLAPPVRRICCSTHYSRTTPCVPSSCSLSSCFSIPRVCTQRVMFLAVALYNSIAPKGSEILSGGGLLVRTRALALLQWQRGTLPRTAVQTYFHNCIAPIPLCVCMCACMRVSLRVSLRVPASLHVRRWRLRRDSRCPTLCITNR